MTTKKQIQARKRNWMIFRLRGLVELLRSAERDVKSLIDVYGVDLSGSIREVEILIKALGGKER